MEFFARHIEKIIENIHLFKRNFKTFFGKKRNASISKYLKTYYEKNDTIVFELCLSHTLRTSENHMMWNGS